MKSHKSVAHVAMALLLSIVFLPALVAAKSRNQPQLLVVYWSAPDCPCYTWREPHSGLKQKFEKSPDVLACLQTGFASAPQDLRDAKPLQQGDYRPCN